MSEQPTCTHRSRCMLCGRDIPLESDAQILESWHADGAMEASMHTPDASWCPSFSTCVACAAQLVGSYDLRSVVENYEDHGVKSPDSALRHVLPRLVDVLGKSLLTACSGHSGHPQASVPEFQFVVADDESGWEAFKRLADTLPAPDTDARPHWPFVCVRARIANTGSNQDELDAWWNRTIRRLEAAVAPSALGASKRDQAVH